MKRLLVAVVIASLIIGGLIGHIAFPKETVIEREVVVEKQKEYVINELTFNKLQLTLDETKGTVLINGLNRGDLWLGNISGISMFPTMKDKSAVIVETIAIDNIAVGDIIVFQDPFAYEWVGHRVSQIGIDTCGWFADTLADNRETTNGNIPYRVREHEMLGKARIYFDY